LSSAAISALSKIDSLNTAHFHFSSFHQYQSKITYLHTTQSVVYKNAKK